MDYLLDSKGQKVKVYDLHTVLYPDHAVYDGRHLLPNVYDCRAFGCGCGAPSGMEMPFDKAKETFNGLREDMRCHIQMLADVVFKDGHELVLSYREFEPRRLDVLGYTSTRSYRAWLTKSSRRHPFGQVRANAFIKREVK